MSLYVLTADGYGPYGSAIYLIGVFDDKEKATEIASKYNVPTKTTKVKLNKSYDLNYDDRYAEWSNKNFLGGYEE